MIPILIDSITVAHYNARTCIVSRMLPGLPVASWALDEAEARRIAGIWWARAQAEHKAAMAEPEKASWAVTTNAHQQAIELLPSLSFTPPPRQKSGRNIVFTGRKLKGEKG